MMNIRKSLRTEEVLNKLYGERYITNTEAWNDAHWLGVYASSVTVWIVHNSQCTANKNNEIEHFQLWTNPTSLRLDNRYLPVLFSKKKKMM